MKTVLQSVFALMVFLCGASAQFQVQRDSSNIISPISAEDSLRSVNQVAGSKVLRLDTVSTAYTPTKSPGIALLLSAVLPGAGQFYNESYWKIPILVGFGYYFASQWIDNNDSTKHYRELFARSITETNKSGVGRYQELREFYKDQRDAFSWYIFIYYIVNLVDAYVDASLYDFNVGDDLSIRVTPSLRQVPVQQVGLNFKINF